MEELNKLLNDALQTKNQDYVCPDGMLNCFKAFEKLSRKDSAASKVLMYFFPENACEKRTIKNFGSLNIKMTYIIMNIALLKIYYNDLSIIISSRISYPSKGK